jgi:hypothetical protein
MLLCVLSLTGLERQGWESAVYVAGIGLDGRWKWGVEVNSGQQACGNRMKATALHVSLQGYLTLIINILTSRHIKKTLHGFL